MVLGWCYGMGVGTMCEKLGMGVDEGRALMDAVNKRSPYVKLLAERVSAKAQRAGQIRTIGGRIRHFNKWEYIHGPGVPLSESAARSKYGNQIRRAYTHKALNSLIQGSAADMMKQAIVAVYNEGYLPAMTVHDELDFTDIESPEQAEIIKKIMLFATDCTVPMQIDLDLGSSWKS